MFSPNQIKLTIISVVTLTLSGFLFYQGLKSEFAKPQKVKTPENTIQKNVQEASIATDSANKENKYKVIRVVDGDTIEVEVNAKAEKIRYIGVNTPETVDPRRPVQCFGKEASNENKRLVEGKEVILEKDVSETDKFKRLLRYVYLPLDDGTTLFVNDYLVREGFAQVDTFPPDVKYQQRFLEAQKDARYNNMGLWAKCKG